MEAALRRHKCSLVVIALILACGRPAAAQDTRALLGTLQSQLRAGQLEAARETARRYVALDGANPLVWYNLAGLEERAGDRAAAIAAFERAVAAGFDDFRAAEADADLGGLRQDRAFVALRDASQTRLRERCAGREVLLTAGTWSPWRDLTDRDGGDGTPTARLRLRCTGESLEIEAEVHDANPADVLAPWQGGAGLVVAVAAADEAGGSDGTRFQEVALGLQQKLPVGAILVGHWQQLVELAPKLRYDPATKGLVYLAKIPWSALAPHDPLLDDELRLNVTYVSLRREGGRAHAALLDDPAAGRRRRALAPRRRPARELASAVRARCCAYVPPTPWSRQARDKPRQWSSPRLPARRAGNWARLSPAAATSPCARASRTCPSPAVRRRTGLVPTGHDADATRRPDSSRRRTDVLSCPPTGRPRHAAATADVPAAERLLGPRAARRRRAGTG